MSEEKIVNYPSNSHKQKAAPKADASAEKKIERITKGEVVQRKKSIGRRIVESFTGDDAQSVGAYLLFDVLIPAAKTMIMDAASQGVERMLFGDVRPRSSGSSIRTGYTNYNRMSSNRSTSTFRDEPRSISRSARVSHNFDEVILGTRGDAEAVIDHLTNLIDKYDVASVSDLYELVGITGNFTDDKWGWTAPDVRGFGVRPVREGYLLDLPKPNTLD